MSDKAVDTGVGGKEDLRTVAGLLGILWQFDIAMENRLYHRQIPPEYR